MKHRSTAPDLAVARRRYEVAKAVFLIVVGFTVVASLVLILLALQEIKAVAEDNRADRAAIDELITQQREMIAVIKAEDSKRAAAVNEVIRRITEGQKAQLAEHDLEVQRYLNRVLKITDAELRAPENKESGRTVVVVPGKRAPAPAPRCNRKKCRR